MTVEIPSILLPCPQKYMKYSGLKKEKTDAHPYMVKKSKLINQSINQSIEMTSLKYLRSNT